MKQENLNTIDVGFIILLTIIHELRRTRDERWQLLGYQWHVSTCRLSKPCVRPKDIITSLVRPQRNDHFCPYEWLEFKLEKNSS